MLSAVQNASNNIPSETAQDLDEQHEQSLMLDPSSVISLIAARKPNNKLDPDHEFNTLFSMDSHAMSVANVQKRECDHRRFKISHPSIMAQEATATILKDEKEGISNTPNHNLPASYRVDNSFDEAIFEHFLAQIGLQTNENETESSVANVTDTTASTEPLLLKARTKFDGNSSASDSTLSIDSLSETQPNRFAHCFNTSMMHSE
jgi:hypothetical protein